MAAAFRAELQKAHRRHDLAVCLLIPLAAALWLQMVNPGQNPDVYITLLGNMPAMNALFMPVAMAMLASRLWEVEVRGETFKLLYTLQTRRSLFTAKALLGLLEVLFTAGLEIGLLPLMARLRHAEGPLPAGQLAQLFLCTAAVDIMLFFSELLLTVLLASPLPALCIGLAGSMVGLFSAALPQAARWFIPWGYFIPLSTIVMDYDAASRSAVYRTVPLDLPLLLWTLALAAGLYFYTWRVIRRKEV